MRTGRERRVRRHDVMVDGLRLHVAEAGEGPPLVLLHGLSASHHNWEHTIAAFAEGWHVVAPDLPGHGESAKPDAPYTIDFFAGMIRSLGRELGLDEVVVMGNSLGGQIAIELAITYPRWTRALVLAAPAGGFTAPLRAIGPALGAAAAPRLLRLTLPRTLDRCFYDRSSSACAMRRRLLADRLAHPDFPDFARAVARSLAGALAAGRQPLRRLTQPTLLVWGRNDRLVALSHSRRIMREVRHARLVVFDRCGHLPMLEQAERFNRVADEFLSSVGYWGMPNAWPASGGR